MAAERRILTIFESQPKQFNRCFTPLHMTNNWLRNIEKDKLLKY